MIQHLGRGSGSRALLLLQVVCRRVQAPCGGQATSKGQRAQQRAHRQGRAVIVPVVVHQGLQLPLAALVLTKGPA